MTAHWKGRASFAEIAEAIGCSTGDIVAALVKEDGYRVLYTTDTERMEEATAWIVECSRDADGILLAGPPREMPGAMSDLKAVIDEALKDEEE